MLYALLGYYPFCFGGHMEKVIKVGVGVIIEYDNKILLGHRVNNYRDSGGIYEPDSWTLPGGKQEFEETIIEAAKREVKEETNLDTHDVRVLTAIDDFQENKHYITITCIAKVNVPDMQVTEPDKIDEWRWFAIDDLPENLYSPSKNSINYYKERNEFHE